MSARTRSGARRFLYALLVTIVGQCVVAPADADKRRVPVVKPTAPIGIDFALANLPTVGSPLRIELRISPSQDFTDGMLSLSAPDTLVVLAPAGVAPLPPIRAGETLTLTVEVMALTQDVHHLGVFVEGRVAGADSARNVMIPIRLASARSERPAVLKGTGSGQAIRVLPAVESVR
jgi:hypothetical protein